MKSGRIHTVLRVLDLPSVLIEPACQCDGSACNQPLFNSEGGLHAVVPHYHLVEWDAAGLHYYLIPLTAEELDSID
jgi:hypothetical protein